MRVKIHHEGTNILVVLLLIILLILAPLWIFLNHIIEIPIIATTVLGLFYLLVVNFFRSPKRAFVGDQKNVVVAGADGKVVALEQVYEPEYLKCECLQLSIFMSVFNVHANWFPVNGEVVFAKHHSGRFMAAYLPKASTENERSTVVIRTPENQLVLVRQIAGAVARRIVTYARKGIEASVEDHMGFIKFGSRVDIYLPLGTTMLVNINDRTVGGVTRVAVLHPENNKCQDKQSEPAGEGFQAIPNQIQSHVNTQKYSQHHNQSKPSKWCPGVYLRHKG